MRTMVALSVMGVLLVAGADARTPSGAPGKDASLTRDTYGDHDIGNVVLTVSDIGVLGYMDYPTNAVGSGFRYASADSSLLFEGSLLWSSAYSWVSDAMRNPDGTQDRDFAVADGGDLSIDVPGDPADQQGVAMFHDGPAAHPSGVLVQQNTGTWASPPNDDFVIVYYAIINTNSYSLNNCYVGMYLDWDLSESDTTGYDAETGIGYQHSGTAPYVGLASLTHWPSTTFRSIDNAVEANPPSNPTDATKYGWLTSGFTTTSHSGGDLAMVAANGPFTIPGGYGYISVGFAIVAGDDLEDLKVNTMAARALVIGGFETDEIPPAAIIDLAAVSDVHDVLLNWSVPYDNVGVTGFRIYKHLSTTDGGTQVAHILNGSTQTYTVPGVCGNPTINFLYDVRAEDAAGNIADPSNFVGEFDYSAGIFSGPAIVVTPTRFTASVEKGYTASDTVLVTNIGHSLLTITSANDNQAWLTLELPSALPLDIQSGATVAMTIGIEAGSLEEGQHEALISIGSNDPDDPVVGVDVSLSVWAPMIEMVSIPGGTFQMGADNQWAFLDERPVHQVTVSGFSLSKYEVTNDQMCQVLQWAFENGKVNATSTTVTNTEGDVRELLNLDDTSGCDISFTGMGFAVGTGLGNHPCKFVTWYGAQAFCNYLSDMEGLQRCISFIDWSCNWTANGYRLPTEAQWEYACRAGTTTDFYNGNETYDDGCTEPWLDPNCLLIAWYCGNCHPPDDYWSHSVGLKQQNGFGLYDMSGNAGEWCWDWVGAYSSAPQTDPMGPAIGTERVLRGGYWSDIAQHCRSANRSQGSPGYGNNEKGFRPARR